MKDENLTLRDAAALPQTERWRMRARDAAADALDWQSKQQHSQARMRKLLRARAMWPRFMRRIVKEPARSPW